MELKAKKITPAAFEEYGTVLDPFNCGEPINPGSLFPYYHDRMPLTFAGGSVVTLSVQIYKKRPLSFDVTEAHDDTEELFGGFNCDVVFHVGSANKEKPDYSKFEAFILPKYYWVRLKRSVFHEAAFIIDGDETVGWVILPPYTAYNDTRLYSPSKPIKIVL